MTNKEIENEVNNIFDGTLSQIDEYAKEVYLKHEEEIKKAIRKKVVITDKLLSIDNNLVSIAEIQVILDFVANESIKEVTTILVNDFKKKD